MGSHKGWDRHFVTVDGLAMRNGRSLNLAKGQFGVVNMQSAPNKRGNEVVDTFTALDPSTRLELRLGIAPLGEARSQSNKAASTPDFKISEVVGLTVDAPKQRGVTVDHFRIGYDGLNPDTAIVMENGDNEVIEVNVSGKPLGLLGLDHSQMTFKLYLEAPNTGDFTMQEIIENAVKRFNEMTVIGGVPINNYVEAFPVNSKSVALTGANYSFFKLTIADNGDQTSLGLVQAQYPDQVVTRENFMGSFSTYTILAPTATVLAPYVTLTSSVLAVCDECPAGFTANGEDLCTQDAGVTTAWANSETCKVSTEKYTITLADDECGDSMLSELQAYYAPFGLTVALDTDVTVAPNAGGCMRRFSTTVNTNVLCERCSPEVNGMFESEAPIPFKNIDWQKVEREYDATALMGIDFVGKATTFLGDEQMRDTMPMMMSPVKLNIRSGGGNVSESFSEGRLGRFNVKLISIASEPDNYGFQFFDWENRGNYHHLGRQRFDDNNFGNWALGMESHLKAGVQYVDYVLSFRRVRLSQSFTGEKVENFNYHILAEVGKHENVEAILNALATKAGVPVVQAFE